MNEPTITFEGNTSDAFKLNNTGTVGNVSIACTPRTKNNNTGEWEDGTTIWIRALAFNNKAAAYARSINRKGMRVHGTGRLQLATWTDQNGQDRQQLEVLVDALGPTITPFQDTAAHKAEQQSSNPWGAGQPAQQQGDPWMTHPQQQAPRPASPPAPQPAPPAPQPGQGWQQQPAPQSGWGSGAGTNDEPPPF